MNKKGISPLIATVLIIGFTINWINDLVGGQTDLQQCQTDAGNKCTDYINLIEYSATETGGATTAAKVFNLAAENPSVAISFLDASGNSLGVVQADPTNFTNGQVTTNITGVATTVKFIVKAGSTYKDTPCEVACGDGVTLDVT